MQGRAVTLRWHACQSLMHLWLSGAAAREEEVAVLAPGIRFFPLPIVPVLSCARPPIFPLSPSPHLDSRTTFIPRRLRPRGSSTILFPFDSLVATPGGG